MLKRTALTLLFFVAASALAEDAKARAAREELERQLHQLVGKQPTRVRVDFIGLEDPNYRIEEATFELDGRGLRTPLLSQLSNEGTHEVWNGDVTPGKHTVKVLLVFSNQASIVLSDEGGYRWKVGGDVSFEVNSGIEVRVQVAPKRDDKQADVSKRFKLSLPAQPVMIAQLDDGKMPEPAPKPVIVAEVVDAGPPALTAEQLAAAEKQRKAAEAAEAKKAAADAKQQKALEAAEAKKQKATELAEARAAALAAKQEKATELAEARAAALAAKQEKAAAALEARRAAAEEKKRAAEAKNSPPAPVGDAGAPVAVAAAEPAVDDAGAPEVVDAGAPAVVAAEPVDAGAPAPVAAAPAAEEEGPPWLAIGIAGAVAALIFLIVVARRRARPPTLDD